MEGTGRDSSGAWVDVDKNGDDGNGEETTTMLPDQGGKPNTLVGEVIGKLGDIELANPENQGGTIQSSHDPKGGEQNLSSTAIVALIFLVLQNSMAVLIMRYTLVHPGEKEFLALTAVIMAEAFKTGVSLSILCLDGSFVEMFDDKIDVLKTSIPALIFLVQNNLQYIAVKNLHAATYQVLYQVKILTTAVVWVMVFRTPLGWKKWCALCFLLSGQHHSWFVSDSGGEHYIGTRRSVFGDADEGQEQTLCLAKECPTWLVFNSARTWGHSLHAGTTAHRSREGLLPRLHAGDLHQHQHSGRRRLDHRFCHEVRDRHLEGHRDLTVHRVLLHVLSPLLRSALGRSFHYRSLHGRGRSLGFLDGEASEVAP
mmetsp:Transcript_36605/g.93266  ORF Transcript_36605/g.93266 Transcript_36605/m.93266 type:complete len:369 (+) Transcript_36605:49-1155(+)